MKKHLNQLLFIGVIGSLIAYGILLNIVFDYVKNNQVTYVEIVKYDVPINEADKLELAKTISAEACSEGMIGMWMVGNTIDNRANIKNKAPLEIIKEPSQYYGYTNPNKEEIYLGCTKEANLVAELMLKGDLIDITNGATCFRKESEALEKWHKRETARWKDHIFYECI